MNAGDAPQSLTELDLWFATVDAVNEADPGVRHASKATLRAGQAAVDVINGRRGRS